MLGEVRTHQKDSHDHRSKACLMILRIPLLGLVRFEPFRDLRRVWLWLTAPASSKVLVWSDYLHDDVPIRSLSDGDLLLGLYDRPRYLPERVIEADRRGISIGLKPPQWVRIIAAARSEDRPMAEKLFRPYRVKEAA